MGFSWNIHTNILQMCCFRVIASTYVYGVSACVLFGHSMRCIVSRDAIRIHNNIVFFFVIYRIERIMKWKEIAIKFAVAKFTNWKTIRCA